ncbi:hypothetical protein [Couchioplanes azureus]|uniref:hypothetical protein n=1 Tax=Couchioplanes caeruleus TaxID=56438 RepID=UPI0016708498|nr:hypothetical protein [Couchioplanes caeruleus]
MTIGDRVANFPPSPPGVRARRDRGEEREVDRVDFIDLFPSSLVRAGERAGYGVQPVSEDKVVPTIGDLMQGEVRMLERVAQSRTHGRAYDDWRDDLSHGSFDVEVQRCRKSKVPPR